MLVTLNEALADGVSPIKPDQVTGFKTTIIPTFVIAAFNKMIAKNYSGKYSRVKQCDIIEEILKNKNVKREEIFANKWLDIEDIYREAGWKVTYDKPAYNETYEPTFEFTTNEKWKR